MAVENDTRFLTALLSCVADGVFTVDEELRITSFNQRAERITGVAAGDALGRRCSDVLRADICKDGCPIRRTMETNREVVDQPVRILVDSAHPTPVSVSSALFRKTNGRFLGAVGTFRDLSALEQLRDEIEERDGVEDMEGKSDAFREVFGVLPVGPQPAGQRPAVSRRPASLLGRAEADAIRRTLSAAGGCIGRAAKELGISRTTLWRKMKKHGIHVGE